MYSLFNFSKVFSSMKLRISPNTWQWPLCSSEEIAERTFWQFLQLSHVEKCTRFTASEMTGCRAVTQITIATNMGFMSNKKM